MASEPMLSERPSGRITAEPGPHPVVPRATALFIIGAVLLVVGGLALWQSYVLAAGTPGRIGSGALPNILAGMLMAVGAGLLVQGLLARPDSGRRWQPWALAIVTVVVLLPSYQQVLLVLAALIGSLELALWSIDRGLDKLFRNFGPVERSALVVLHVTIAVAIACYARLAGLGMLLLGGLLGFVGTDVNTGNLRFTFGMAGLQDGIGLVPLLLGLTLAAEGTIALASPGRALALIRHGLGLSPGGPPGVAVALALRVAAVIALIMALLLTYRVNNGHRDVGLLAVAGCLGLAAKLCGWNRWLILLGVLSGPQLEVFVRRALLLSRGNPDVFWTRPTSAALLAIALAVIAVVAIEGWTRYRRQPATVSQ